MNPLDQRITIAESVGWLEILWSQLTNPREAAEAKHYCRSNEQRRCEWLPNYLTDLNAMHEVEKRLTLNQRETYYSWLIRICDREHRMASINRWLAPTATAAQRAEAYLRTIGKWKD